MSLRNFNILHIEDDEMLREIYYDIFKENISQNIIQSNNKTMALMEIEKIGQYHIVICDYELPDGNGLDIYNHLRAITTQIPFCLFSSRNDLNLDQYKSDQHFKFFLKLDNHTQLVKWVNSYKV